VYARLLCAILLTVELCLRYHMCDLGLHSKYEEDRTEAMVAIVDER